MQTSLLTTISRIICCQILYALETKLQEGTEIHQGLHSISPIPTHGLLW